MRNIHRNILRKIEEQGLNPKSSYVLGKNGTLSPKRGVIFSKDLKKEIVEQVKVDPQPILEEEVKLTSEETVAETQEEKVENLNDQTSTQKKKPSFKKKKSEATDE